MDLVLVPGDVYPCRSVSKTSSDTKANVVSPPGIQLLATCKQAYNEGHELFYSSNAFHLPPTMTFEWSNGLQAKHKAMVKRINITLGLDDLTVTTLKEVDRRYSSDADGLNELFIPLDDVLYDLRRCKMRYIVAWASLEEIDLCSFTCTQFLPHCDVVANIGFFRRLGSGPYWSYILDWRDVCVSARVCGLVSRVGWEKPKEWLQMRKPDEMPEDFRLSKYLTHTGWMLDINALIGGVWE